MDWIQSIKKIKCFMDGLEGKINLDVDENNIFLRRPYYM